MKWIVLSYLILGVIAIFHVFRKAKKLGVVSVTEEAIVSAIVLPFLIWPVFVLNDHFLEFPKRVHYCPVKDGSEVC